MGGKKSGFANVLDVRFWGSRDPGQCCSPALSHPVLRLQNGVQWFKKKKKRVPLKGERERECAGISVEKIFKSSTSVTSIHNRVYTYLYNFSCEPRIRFGCQQRVRHPRKQRFTQMPVSFLHGGSSPSWILADGRLNCRNSVRSLRYPPTGSSSSYLKAISP